MSVILFILALPILIYFLLVGAGSYLIHNDKVRAVDAIVVLSGDEGGRVLQAVEIYQSEKIKYFVFTKTDQEDIGQNNTYSESLMRIAIDLKVPSDSMFVTKGESKTTIEESEALLTLAKERNIGSYLIVTDPYHTRRTNIIFDNVFAESGIATYVHAVQDHWYQPYNWMFKITGWKVTLGEYLGLFSFYRL